MEIILISLSSVIFCLLSVLLCRRYVNKIFDSVDTIFDKILSKKYDSFQGTIGESRISKVTHKAHRIMDMFVSETTKVKVEKEAIQSFISDLSHQMKTPIASISMYSDLLLQESLTHEEYLEFILRIKNSTDKLQWMMNCLIKVSRLEVGAIELMPKPNSIQQMLSEAIGSVVAASSKKNITISVSNFKDKSLIFDKNWIRETMVNVLENAVKYSYINGFIKVTVDSLPMYTKINITDYGIGIGINDWNMIFKRFYRGQNAQECEGAGLGLYLASTILEKQGGYIMVDSKIGKYTTFSLFLQNC